MKKISYLILVSLILVSYNYVHAQRGKNGPKVITTTNTVVNEYTTLTANASTGATSLTVAANTLNANNRFGAGNVLAAGDLIFIIQMQGASVQGGQWWYNYGYINDYFNTGLYEFAQVVSVQGSNIINLSCGLTYSYTASGKVQIVRVPRYTTLTLNSGAELTCDAWDGTKAGVLVVETMGNVDVNGTINATGKGFRGGVLSPTADQTDIGLYCTTDSTYGAKKGEGIAGYGPVSDGMYGRGAPANGGGGGNAHNGGGGGGSNVSSNFAWNGAGFPDTTTSSTYIQAWDLEVTTTVPSGVPFHKNASYGGGRGGYTFSATNMDALTVGPANSLWGGDFRRTYGGLGGWPLNANQNGLPRLFMGGGGGSASQNNNWGGAGGKGGGIIYLMTYGSVSGVGSIVSNGNNGNNSAGSPAWNERAGNDGAGGAGGGGAIVINATGAISSITAQANGGNGGNQIKSKGWSVPANMEAEGPGGGGGGGYIAVSNGTIVRTTLGGMNGTSTAISPENIGVTEFPPNGATKGGPGINNASVSNYTINAANVLACQGQPVTLTATISGTLPSGASYGWYASEFGSTVLSTNLTLTINNPQTTTTYYFGICPGTYRVPVVMTVSAFAPDAGNNTSFCQGGSVTLNATGGTTYSWLPTTGLSNASINNPVCNVGTTTLYTVHITNADGCQANDTIRVTVTPFANATITPQSPLCINSAPVTLTAAQTGGIWYGPGITSPLAGTFNPAISGVGNIQVIYSISGGCSAADTTYIQVNALPTVNLGHDTTLCQGQTLLLNAGNPGSNYVWTPGGSVAQTLSVSTNGQYSVQVTNTANCSRRDTVNVAFLANANASITPHTPLCINSSPITLTAAQTGGVWSGPGITNPATGAFNPTLAGIGNIQVIYSIAGLCGDADTTHIMVNALPVVNLGHDTTLCQGQSLLLNAGNPGSSYAWAPGGGVSQTLSVSASGQYSVQVTNAANCSLRDTINVSFLANANATITPHAPLCINSSPVTLTAAQTGGVWSGPGITNPATGVFNPALSGSGTIQVIYTISGLCGDDDTTTIVVNPLPIVNLGNDTTLCQGSSLLLNAGNTGSTYLWGNASTGQTLTVSTSGTYWVEVTNTNLCSKRDSINVNVVPMADATIGSVLPMCSNFSAFNLNPAQTGGVWSGNGITNAGTGTFSPSVAGAGISVITYTISGACGDMDTIHISVLPTPMVTADTGNPICPDYNNGSIILTASGGTLPYTYTWSNGGNTSSGTNFENGTYTVTVSDANNCADIKTIQFDVVINDCESPVIYVPNIFSPNGDGQNDEFHVRGQGIKSLDFVIFDRWGERIFETTEQANFWDGTYKGKDMPVGVYAYYLKATMNDGRKIDKKGNISLVR